MARLGKLLVIAVVVLVGFVGSALFGSTAHRATLNELLRATGGTCYALYNDNTVCAASKSVCVSNGDGTYTYWNYNGNTLQGLTTSSKGNTVPTADPTFICASKLNCGTNPYCSPIGNCMPAGVGYATTYRLNETQCP